jgi:hypothetical protein
VANIEAFSLFLNLIASLHSMRESERIQRSGTPNWRHVRVGFTGGEEARDVNIEINIFSLIWRPTKKYINP